MSNVEVKDKKLRIRVKLGEKEIEISYPLSERTVVEYTKESSTLRSAVDAAKDLVDKLKEK